MLRASIVNFMEKMRRQTLPDDGHRICNLTKSQIDDKPQMENILTASGFDLSGMTTITEVKEGEVWCYEQRSDDDGGS